MTEKATNTNTINFYEEKKWIMAHWFKEVQIPVPCRHILDSWQAGKAIA